MVKCKRVGDIVILIKRYIGYTFECRITWYLIFCAEYNEHLMRICCTCPQSWTRDWTVQILSCVHTDILSENECESEIFLRCLSHILWSFTLSLPPLLGVNRFLGFIYIILEGFLSKSENEKYFTSVLCVYTIAISLRSNFQSVLFT